MQNQDASSQQLQETMPLIDAEIPVEGYNSALQHICGVFRVEPRNQTGLVRGSVRRRKLAQFDAAVVALDAKRVVRDSHMLRDDPGEHLFILFQMHGRCDVTQAERRIQMNVGDICIVDSTASSEFYYHGKFSRQLSLHIPRDEARRRFGEPCLSGADIEKGDTLFPALRGVLTSLSHAPDAAVILPQ